jgi:hypothetical protein
MTPAKDIAARVPNASNLYDLFLRNVEDVIANCADTGELDAVFSVDNRFVDRFEEELKAAGYTVEDGFSYSDDHKDVVVGWKHLVSK